MEWWNGEVRGAGVSVAPIPIPWPVVFVLLVPICNGGCGLWWCGCVGRAGVLALVSGAYSFCGHFSGWVSSSNRVRGEPRYFGRWKVGLPRALDG